MTRSLALLPLALLLPAAAPAQRSTFYWLADVGALSSGGKTSFRSGLAGGGEIAITKGFSAGPEMGLIAPARGVYWDNIAGLGSLNGYYHIRYDHTRRFDPFGTAGYAVMFRTATKHMFQYGAGFNYWVREDLAFRTEFRDRTFGDNNGNAHLWTFRVGVAFTHLFP